MFFVVIFDNEIIPHGHRISSRNFIVLMINSDKVILNSISMVEIIISFVLVDPFLFLSSSLIDVLSGCFPYIKYHCTQRVKSDDLIDENRLYTFFKLFNLGLPTLLYGLAAIFLIRHWEWVKITEHDQIKIFFLIQEDH